MNQGRFPPECCMGTDAEVSAINDQCHISRGTYLEQQELTNKQATRCVAGYTKQCCMSCVLCLLCVAGICCSRIENICIGLVNDQRVAAIITPVVAGLDVV